jgi:hypothetical protein
VAMMLLWYWQRIWVQCCISIRQETSS